MPRKREVAIGESLEDLQKLEEEYRGKPEAVRITVLRLMKQDEKLGIEEVAGLVGFSKPTVKRWWRAYREGGVEAVLGLGAKRPADPDDGLSLLKQKLIAGEFSGLDDVRAWLTAHQEESVRKSVRTNPRPLAKSTPSNTANLAYPESADSETLPLTSARLMKFLSDLPLSHQMPEWSGSFCNALQSLLGDVDRISLSLNVQCDLLNPEKYSPDMVITQNILSGTKAVNPILKDDNKADEEAGHFTRLLDNLRRRKFPFAEYHPPHTFAYYYGGQAYLGVIALWRERGKTPISATTLDAMERLRGFMVYALSDFVARHNMAKPIDHAFDLAVQGLMNETGLTMQERRIMILQLLGLSYEEVADTLNISLNTVRYHLRSIYTKTGAHSQAELFAKYFTPRFDPQRSI